MPSFVELVDLRLGQLKLAVEDWSAVITKLKGLETDADSLDKKARQATWQGENAQVSKAFVTKTAKEFRDAVTQATSIRNVLRDLHTQLTSAKSQLKAAVDEAPSKGLHIDAKGRVSAVQSPTNSVEKGGISFTPLSIPQDEQQKIFTMERRIARILEAADEDDRIATGALRMLGNEAHNFSDIRYRDLNSADKQLTADAKRAVDLAKQGAELTDKELHSLNTLLRTHQGDPHFAEEFAVQLGARDTLEFWAKVADPPLTVHDEDRRALLATLQDQLGATLGSASQSDSPRMDAWEQEVIALGDQRLGIDAAGDPYGFQVMSSLMQKGEYDADFLTPYGNELVAFERTQQAETGRDPSELWARDADRSHLNFGEKDDYGADPMVGFLEALGHSPEGSTAFLGSQETLVPSSSDEKVTNFSYLTKEREWPPALDGNEKTNPGHEALGHALTSATLGYPYDDPSPHVPDVPSADDRADVMKQVVELYGSQPELLEEQQGLRSSLTTIAVGRIDDLNYSIDNIGGSADVADRDRLTWKADGDPQDFGRSNSITFLRELAVDQDSYNRISAAQQIYITSGIEANKDNYDDALDFSLKGAVIHGILDQSRENEIIREHDQEAEVNNLGLEKQGEWRKYVVNATLAAAAGSAACMMGPGAGVAAATLVPLAVDFGSAAAQTHYATNVMDQIDAAGEVDSRDVINTLDDAKGKGEDRMMLPANKFLDSGSVPSEISEDFPGKMGTAYEGGRDLVGEHIW